MDQLQEQHKQTPKKIKSKRNRNIDTDSVEMARVRRKTKGQDMSPRNRKKKAHGK